MEGLWGFVIIGGPILLALVLIIAKLRNRRMPAPGPEGADRTPSSYENAGDRKT
ncbi:hypothetical protein [Sphingomonas sp.]|jgi:hypothetical protein|uniref:hypothetical protein n=1 Tax=Sphingomonas sp. TaxID=28214 RepID=UPI002E3385F1|nr:hypothetical protein [Sphingomonas sp.]HEX4695050.1 hypothetical protein [Sphingomonas sp.]